MNKELLLEMSDWFSAPGAYVLSDGQYGSTGKGVIAAAMAECCAERVDVVVSSAGTNSGHSFFHGDTKVVLKQLPTFAIAAKYLDPAPIRRPWIYLSAGAVIDPKILEKEQDEHGVNAVIHPHAAVIRSEEKERDQTNVKSMASTGQGVGPALIRKMERTPDAVWLAGSPTHFQPLNLRRLTAFFEVSQGYSLGISSGFYPYVTSRECTASQALSDAGVSPAHFRKGILSCRTFPIRVGNTESTSGPCYLDQKEIMWSEVGVEPEMTTVTQRQRRIFTWSDQQFMDAVAANTPDTIFLNFVNYLKTDVEKFVREHVIRPYSNVMGVIPKHVLLGYGPKSEDIRVFTS